MRWIGGIVAVLMASLMASAHAQTPSRACEANLAGVPPARWASLAKGFNLSGWFEDNYSPAPDMAVLRSLRRAGMTYIRLPVRGEWVIADLSSDERVAQTLRRLDQALSQLNAIGFTVSVDLHFGGRFSELYKDNADSAQRMLELAWTSLASVIASHPAGSVLADLLNEPEIDPDAWQSVAVRLAGFVRGKLPDTTLIVGPTFWQRADSLPRFVPLDDPNVVYAIHFYSPMVFTHQGHWDAKDPLSKIRGLPFPFSSNDAAVKQLRQSLVANNSTSSLAELDKALAQGGAVDQIARDLAPAVEWQARYRRPIIINEFGVLKDGAPPQSRQRWLGAVVDAARRNCWGWVHWEYAAGFGLLNADGKPDPQTMRALLGGQTRRSLP